MNLTHRMTKTITVASMTGRSGSGDATYGTSRELPAMVENWHEVTRNARGEDIVISTKLATHDEIKYNDRVWLPGDTIGTDSPKIPQVIKSATGIDGTVLYEVKL